MYRSPEIVSKIKKHTSDGRDEETAILVLVNKDVAFSRSWNSAQRHRYTWKIFKKVPLSYKYLQRRSEASGIAF